MNRIMPRRISFVTLACVAGVVAVSAAAALQEQEQLPPGHPAIGLPPGHPPIGDDARPRGVGPRVNPADPEDVSDIDRLIEAYYDTVSDEAGAERDWNRFRSLFIPEARFIAAQPLGPEQPCVVMGVEQFIQFNAAYFERGGYVERDIHRIVERFGNAAHVFSTYEARRSKDDPEPYSRGVNSMQLVHDGSRWWVASVMWDFEREGNIITEQYLPAAQEREGP